WLRDSCAVWMKKPGDAALLARFVHIPRFKSVTAVNGSLDAGDKGQDELLDAEEPDVSVVATELFAIPQNVVGCRERMGFAGEVTPAAHQLRSVHVDQRICDMNVFGLQLPHQIFMRQAVTPLVQVVNVVVTRVPALRRQVD